MTSGGRTARRLPWRRSSRPEPCSGSSGGSHALHYLLEDPFAGDELSDAFLYAVMNELSFAAGPLYALLHEASYAQGLRDPVVRAADQGGVRRVRRGELPGRLPCTSPAR